MNDESVSIDPGLWNYEDDRVTKLFEGKYTLTDFWSKSIETDPWHISWSDNGWTVRVFTPEALRLELADKEERTKRGLPVSPSVRKPLPVRIVPLAGTPQVSVRTADDRRLPQPSSVPGPAIPVVSTVNFTVGPTLWLLDDNRIDRLYSGELSMSGFIRASDHNDPWSVVRTTGTDGQMSATMQALLPEDVVQHEIDYKTQIRQKLAHTGGITGRDIYSNRPIFLQVFPELKDGLDVVDKQIADEKCTGCAIGRIAEPLVDILLSIPLVGREISPLSQLLSEQAMRRLRSGADLDQALIPIEHIPYEGPHVIPVRAVPRPGDPKWIMYHPDEVSELLKGKSGAVQGPRDTTPRPACFDCCRKHLAKAAILFGESMLGYPVTHWWLAIGNMSEAEDEVVARSPNIAEKIRAARLVAMSSGIFDPLTRRYKGTIPDLLPIIEEVTDLAFIEASGGFKGVHAMERSGGPAYLPMEWPAGMHDYADLYNRLPRREGSIHGIRHAVSVAARGTEIALAANLPQRSAEIVRLFGLFHDCGRLTDGPDPDHGLRAAEQVRLFRVMLVQLDDEAIELLYTACLRHNLGEMSDNVIIQTCWDADRLDLGRVGVTPDHKLLGSKEAKSYAQA